MFENIQKKLMQEQRSKSPHLEVETLRKKLQESFSEIDELKSMVQKLSSENCVLKSRIDSSISAFDVQL